MFPCFWTEITLQLKPGLGYPVRMSVQTFALYTIRIRKELTNVFLVYFKQKLGLPDVPSYLRTICQLIKTNLGYAHDFTHSVDQA